MSNSTLCRTCLATNFEKMYDIEYVRLQEIFEKVTNNKVNTKDGTAGLCYICYAQWLKCRRFYEMCQISENILKELFNKNKKITQATIAHHNRRLTLSVTPVECFYSGSEVLAAAVKKEPLDTEPVIVKDKSTENNEVAGESLSLKDVLDISEVNSNDLMVNMKQKLKEITEVSVNADSLIVNVKEELDDITEVSINSDNLIVNVKEELDDITEVSINSDNLMVNVKQELEESPEGSVNSVDLDLINLKEENVPPDVDWGISVPVASEIIIESDELAIEFETTGENIDLEEEIDIEGVVDNELVLMDETDIFQEENVEIELPTPNQGDLPVNGSGLSNKDSLFNCCICKNIFNTTSELNSHMKFHNQVKPCFICDYCGKTFTSKANVKSHINIHIESHFCTLCDKKFINKRYLKEHIKVHTREKPVCHQCGKQFIDKSSLNKHNRRIHIEERNINCEICDKKFYSNYHLESHLRVHTREKPYKCSVCEKSFSQKCTLKWHTRIHTGEMTHFCDLCDKSFYRKAHLLQHMSFHSDERPFTCKPCNKSYKTISALAYHKRTACIKKCLRS